MSEVVELHYEEDVASIVIKREKSLNALNDLVLSGIRAAVAELQASCAGDKAYSRCRCVLLRSEGEKAFVAGADIRQMSEASPSERKNFAELGQSTMRSIEALPLPVIAVVQGFALGGGMELALACDLIVASERANFGQPEVNLGLIPGFGGSQRLQLRCGNGVARRLILTGESISASEAHRIGLVDYLVEPEALEAEARALAKKLSSRGPLALAAAKRTMQSLDGEALSSGLENETAEFINLFAHDDTKEGLSAFLEKRSAQFKGK